jgi:hypothetical protein
MKRPARSRKNAAPVRSKDADIMTRWRKSAAVLDRRQAFAILKRKVSFGYLSISVRSDRQVFPDVTRPDGSRCFHPSQSTIR